MSCVLDISLENSTDHFRDIFIVRETNWKHLQTSQLTWTVDLIIVWIHLDFFPPLYLVTKTTLGPTHTTNRFSIKKGLSHRTCYKHYYILVTRRDLKTVMVKPDLISWVEVMDPGGYFDAKCFSNAIRSFRPNGNTRYGLHGAFGGSL